MDRETNMLYATKSHGFEFIEMIAVNEESIQYNEKSRGESKYENSWRGRHYQKQ